MPQGGEYIYVLILIILSLFLSYHIISYILIFQKSSRIFRHQKNPTYLKGSSSIQRYLKSLQLKLHLLTNPYGLTVYKYIGIKYLLSPALFVIILFNSQQLIYSFCISFFMFVLPNILIRYFIKSESTYLINEVSNIVQNIILSLSANMSLYDAMQTSVDVISYPRFKEAYIEFLGHYKMYHFNLLKAIEMFEKRFHSYEFKMFLSMLLQGEKEGNTLELLESLNASLEVTYFKVLKMKEAKRMLFIITSTIISVGNSLMIVAYPMILELSSSFQEIFK